MGGAHLLRAWFVGESRRLRSLGCVSLQLQWSGPPPPTLHGSIYNSKFHSFPMFPAFPNCLVHCACASHNLFRDRIILAYPPHHSKSLSHVNPHTPSFPEPLAIFLEPQLICLEAQFLGEIIWLEFRVSYEVIIHRQAAVIDHDLTLPTRGVGLQECINGITGRWLLWPAIGRDWGLLFNLYFESGPVTLPVISLSSS